MKAIYKKGIFIPIVLTLVILLYSFMQPWSPLSKSELGHLFSYFINMNKFSIELSNEIEKDKIQIVWNNLIIFENGKFVHKNIKKKRYIYGENIFIVKYNSEIIGNVVQYKFNNWHYHKYIFSVFENDNVVSSNLDIIGVDTAVH